MWSGLVRSPIFFWSRWLNAFLNKEILRGRVIHSGTSIKLLVRWERWIPSVSFVRLLEILGVEQGQDSHTRHDGMLDRSPFRDLGLADSQA